MATERLAILLEAVGTSQVVRELEGVSGATAGLGDKASAASGMLRGTAGAGQQLAASLGGVSGVIAASAAGWAAIIGAGAKAASTFYDVGQQVLSFSRASGASMEQSSALVAALDDVGITAEVGGRAIFQLGRRVEDNAEKLRDHGVSAAYDAQGNTDLVGTLLNVADAYNATTDPAERAALVADAFGRSGQQLLPILERGRAGIEAMFAEAEQAGLIFDAEDRQAILDAQAAMDDLGDSVQALSIAAGRLLVPVLTKVADMLTTVADKARDVGDLPYIGDLLSNVAKGAFAWASGNSEAVSSLDDVNAAADQHIRDLEEIEKAQQETLQAILAVPSAQRAYEQSIRSVGSAERSLADARSDLNKLMREGAVDEEKVADARRSLNDATRALGSSQRRLREAQDEYNDALAAYQQFGGDTNAEKLADAEDNLADANDGVASATERQQKAQQDLARAQAGDPEFNDKLAKAKQRVTDAEVSLADAQYMTAQRAYELDGALKEQNGLLAENAGQLGTIRANWEALLARKPEIEGFLSGPLATLMGAGAVAPSSGPAAGSDAWLRQRGGDPSWATITGPAPSGGGTSTVQRVGDIVINITEAVTDPAGLARKIIWNLN